jgi:hypothetical protein
MYRDSATGFVPYDTIRIRAFDAHGVLQGNVRVHCSCTFSPDSVDSLATTFADTLLKPWGTINPVRYWGGGNPEGMETVNCWAIVNGQRVRAQREFYVWFRN